MLITIKKASILNWITLFQQKFAKCIKFYIGTRNYGKLCDEY